MNGGFSFADPYGNRLEVITYDHDEVQNAIAR
jgi:hypothetical protein